MPISNSLKKPAGWCRYGWDVPNGGWRIRVAAGRATRLGSSPTLRDVSAQLAAGGAGRDVVLAPIGFVYENMEIVYDLDVEIRHLCEELGLNPGPRRGGGQPRAVRPDDPRIGPGADGARSDAADAGGWSGARLLRAGVKPWGGGSSAEFPSLPFFTQNARPGPFSPGRRADFLVDRKNPIKLPLTGESPPGI